MSSSSSTNPSSNSNQSRQQQIQIAQAIEAWAQENTGPPPAIAPICIMNAADAKLRGGKYSDGFGNNNQSRTCLVMLLYLARVNGGDRSVRTCKLPSGDELQEKEQSEDVKKAKDAARRAAVAQEQGDSEEAKKAMAELRQITDRSLNNSNCLQIQTQV
jgi:hypothetical protein